MNIDFQKFSDGLVPAIVQDARTLRVLMLGFMNAESLALTERSGRVAFFSRSRQTLWTKGETSGNYLLVESITEDCDNDTLLIKANPVGPVCHNGSDTCFDELNEYADFLFELETIIRERKANPSATSYTSFLFAGGIDHIAQKVGEEAVELIIEAKNNDDELFSSEAADLLFHLMVLLSEKGVELASVLEILRRRHVQRSIP